MLYLLLENMGGIFNMKIKQLNQLRKTDYNLFGNKAASLGELYKELTNIPDGFALSFEFLDEYLSYNNITYTQDQYLAYSTEIREDILNGTMPDPLRNSIVVCINELSKNVANTKFAVRSSSNLEDTSNHSMAGMFESYIQLSTYDEVEHSIKKVYSSLFSDRFLEYVFENNIDLSNLKMGIIIQQFITGTPSGVVFTADTINMDSNLIHINGVNSICANYVNGTFPSSLYVMEKSSKKIIDTICDESSSIIPPEILEELHDLAVIIESILGCPQDIEWTYFNNNVYILQSRAITTLKTKSFSINWDCEQDKKSTWFSLMPTPYTPLMQDIIKIELHEQSEGVYETMFRTDLYCDCIIQNGYAYVKGNHIEDADKKRTLYLNDLAKLHQEGKCIFNDIILPDLLQLTNSLEKYLGKELSTNETLEFLNLSLEYLKMTRHQHWHAIQANEFITIFEKKFFDMFEDMHLEDFYDLIYGFSILARERELLFSMTSIVKNNETLKNIFSSYKSDIILFEHLKREPEAKELLNLIKIYTDEFGICDSGLDTILHPTLSERPDYSIGTIRDLLHTDENIFFKSMKNSLLKKNKVKEIVLNRLKGNIQADFIDMLSLAEKSFITNDNHNYYMEKSYRGFLRLASTQAGKSLCTKGLLKTPEDIQYLHISEIISALKNKELEEDIISQRKKVYESQKKMIAPEIIGNAPNFNNEKYTEPLENKDSNTPISIKGVSGIRKKIIGKIYLGMPPYLDNERILVLPHCHCGDIMPFISKVKGLIYNWGSPYDHHGIIAREMGIPAIYKTNNAMDLLKTDDLVEIDGITGIVTLLN